MISIFSACSLRFFSLRLLRFFAAAFFLFSRFSFSASSSSKRLCALRNAACSRAFFACDNEGEREGREGGGREGGRERRREGKRERGKRKGKSKMGRKVGAVTSCLWQKMTLVHGCLASSVGESVFLHHLIQHTKLDLLSSSSLLASNSQHYIHVHWAVIICWNLHCNVSLLHDLINQVCKYFHTVWSN